MVSTCLVMAELRVICIAVHTGMAADAACRSCSQHQAALIHRQNKQPGGCAYNCVPVASRRCRQACDSHRLRKQH